MLTRTQATIALSGFPDRLELRAGRLVACFAGLDVDVADATVAARPVLPSECLAIEARLGPTGWVASACNVLVAAHSSPAHGPSVADAPAAAAPPTAGVAPLRPVARSVPATTATRAAETGNARSRTSSPAPSNPFAAQIARSREPSRQPSRGQPAPSRRPFNPDELDQDVPF